MGRNLTRWLIPLPAIFFAFIPQTVNATPVAGLSAYGYTIDTLTPIKSDTIYPACGNEIENNINRNFTGEPFQQCGADNFMIHYTGYLTIPANQTIKFMVAADDGGTVKIGETEFGTWNLKGCTWSQATLNTFAAGIYALDGWFFEASGGACYMLAWNINNTGWVIVPDSAFTTEPTATTTTTLTTTTTSTTTTSTTTLPEETSTTTTTTQPATTTTTTTEVQTPPQTTTSTSTTSTTTTTTPSTTTTATPTTELPQPQTVETTEPPTTTTEPSTTTTETPTTTTEPATTTTQTTSTTIPDDSVEPASTTIPATSVPDTVPSETEQPTNTTQPQEYTPETTVSEEQDSSPITITNQITNEQIIEIVTNPETFQTLTVDQAEQLFEELDVTELDSTELEAFIAAVQQAPTEVREAFEKTINIFGSQFENYVPTGSNIPVKTRRTLVAAGALIMAVPSTRVRR